jgi:hypothetical protein
VERDTASLAERLTNRLLPLPGRLVLLKDAALMRRRFPAGGYLLGLLSLALLGVLWLRPDAYLAWVLGIAASGLIYALVLANRLWRPPIEHPSMLDTLPLPDRASRLAKYALACTRTLWPLVCALLFVLAMR